MTFNPEPPQQMMIDHLLTHDVAYCIVGMGIGKTASCLAAWSKLKQAGLSKAVMILAPMRVANLTWPMEVLQWDQFKKLRVANLRTQIGRGAFIAGLADIYVLNYDSIPLLIKLVEKRGGCVPYDTIIYDEVTRAKSPKSRRIAALRELVPPVKRRWGLTGTPAPNSDLDLFAQVRLLDDGVRLGRSFDQFKKIWFHPQNPMSLHSKWVPNGEAAQQRIQEKIADITITLRSSDWLKDVPDATVEDIELTMPDDLLGKYVEFENELVLQLQKEVQITAANAAALVSKLLQFTSGAVYDAEKKVHPIHTLKLDALAKLHKEEKTPLLVAVAFKHEQERIRKRFPEARFFADAGTNVNLQKQLLVQWNRREIPMLVAHPRSIGHGLNLQAGSSRMCWMSLTYSREDYEQFIARLWRRGQKEVVRVYRMMCLGTVDDVVAGVLESKQANERKLLDALILLESVREKRKFTPPKKAVTVDPFWS